MSEKNENTALYTLPVLALRGITAFPGLSLKLELSSGEDLTAVSLTQKSGGKIFLAALRDPTKRPPLAFADFYAMGCVAAISDAKEKNGALLITITGISRARLCAP